VPRYPGLLGAMIRKPLTRRYSPATRPWSHPPCDPWMVRTASPCPRSAYSTGPCAVWTRRGTSALAARKSSAVGDLCEVVMVNGLRSSRPRQGSGVPAGSPTVLRQNLWLTQGMTLTDERTDDEHPAPELRDLRRLVDRAVRLTVKAARADEQPNVARR